MKICYRRNLSSSILIWQITKFRNALWQNLTLLYRLNQWRHFHLTRPNQGGACTIWKLMLFPKYTGRCLSKSTNNYLDRWFNKPYVLIIWFIRFFSSLNLAHYSTIVSGDDGKDQRLYARHFIWACPAKVFRQLAKSLPTNCTFWMIHVNV